MTTIRLVEVATITETACGGDYVLECGTCHGANGSYYYLSSAVTDAEAHAVRTGHAVSILRRELS